MNIINKINMNIIKKINCCLILVFSISCSNNTDKNMIKSGFQRITGSSNKLKKPIINKPFCSRRNFTNISSRNYNSNKQSNELLSSFFEESYDKVVFHSNKDTNFTAIVVVDDITLGPGLGGCRFLDYKESTGDISYLKALEDVKRLARGMTYKSSLAGINLGGGKAVIIGDPQKRTEALLRSFGSLVNNLGGTYVTAPDVNTTEEDMLHISKETKYVTSLPTSFGGGGDPSEFTAYGLYLAMKAAAKSLYGNESLKNKKILIDGVGKVGSLLIKQYLTKEKANIYTHSRSR